MRGRLSSRMTSSANSRPSSTDIFKKLDAAVTTDLAVLNRSFQKVKVAPPKKESR